MQKNIYLYLALACFLGIILIFVFDGYMGLYDTVTLVNGEMSQEISFEQWQEQERWDYLPQYSAEAGNTVVFTYTINNRRFSSYNSDIDISIWKNQEKLAQILTTKIDVGAFSHDDINWNLDTTDLVTGNFTSERQPFTIIIKRGNFERKIVINIYSAGTNSKIIPIPVPIEGKQQ